MVLLPLLSLSLLAAPLHAAPLQAHTLGPALRDDAPAHLGVALRVPHPEALQQFLADLQDPSSPSYHAWLTPASFGERFGLHSGLPVPTQPPFHECQPPLPLPLLLAMWLMILCTTTTCT